MSAVMPEKDLLQAIRDLAKLRGWFCYHTHDSRRSEPGFPDLVLLHERTGQLLFAELKSDRGRVSHAQQRWIDALAFGGHVVHVWRPGHLTGGQITRALTVTEAPADADRPTPREVLA